MRRKDYVISAVLLVVGFAAYWIVVRPRLGPREKDWDAQIAADALTLTQGLRYDLPLSKTDQAKFDEAWEKRRSQIYDAPHLAKLRDRLATFLDFQVAEYADAKDTYLSGRVPERPSAQALIAQARLKEAYGSEAAEMIQQYKDKIREAAYRASPAVAQGRDPDLKEYDRLYDDMVMRWLPTAQATIARLTAPAR